MYKTVTALFFVQALLVQGQAPPKALRSCRHPPPDPGFSDEKYSGTWYEIGKIQTIGGAIFQVGAMCTTATFSPDVANGGGDIGYSSRLMEPDGPWHNATGWLTPLEDPGHFSQRLTIYGVEGAEVDYNVIWLDEESAIEYDCNEMAVGINYCLHFMSRQPVMRAAKLQEMIDFAVSLDLNPSNLPYEAADHEGCW